MKITFITLLIIPVLFSCSGETPKEDINQKYISQAETFFDDMIKQDETIKSFKITAIDTIESITARVLESLRMSDLLSQAEAQNEIVKKYMEIEEMYPTGSVLPATKVEYEKFQKLNDSIQSWMKRAEKLDDKKTVRKRVTFLIDFVLTNGTKAKQRPLALVFDLEGDLVAEDNPKKP